MSDDKQHDSKGQVYRNGKGQFMKGSVPNPKGSKPGPNWNVRVKNAAGEYAVQVMHEVGKAAVNGDMTAAKIILDRTAPPLKPQGEPVNIEGMNGTLAEKADMIMDAVSQGKLPPDVGNYIMNSLTGLSKIREVNELEERIKKLEGGHESNQ